MNDVLKQDVSVSKKALWAGWILNILPVLMLVMSAVMKFARPAAVTEGFEKLGWPQRYAVGLGVLELACTVVFLIPRTAVLGAILMTGYLGGATATHVRIGDPWFTPVILGILIWLGIYVREPRLRALAPWRR